MSELNVAIKENPAKRETMRQMIKLSDLSVRLLALIVNVSEPEEEEASRLLDISRVELSLRHIEENLSKPVSRHEIAKLASLSDTRFHYVFKAATGMSPIAYLRSVRLRKAQALLLQTELSVSEIGERVGYPDIFHFNKVFRSNFRLSPSKYRHEARKFLPANT